MSLESVLWIVGTALAASADDPRLVAATDGGRVWVTVDGGRHWQRVADFSADDDEAGPGLDDEAEPGLDDEAGPGLDDEAGPPRAGLAALDALASDTALVLDDLPVHALALQDDRLLVATDQGLQATPLGEGGPTLLSTVVLDTLAIDGRTVWATAGSDVLRSDDGGRTFHQAASLPAGRARSLAARGSRLLASTDRETFLVDLDTGRRRALGCGAAALAGSEDGSLWRASPRTLERSLDGGETWTTAWHLGARAIAVGASDVWVASGGRVARARDLPEIRLPGLTTPPSLHLSEAAVLTLAWSSRATSRPRLPRLVARAEVRRHREPATREDELIVELLLSWDLDAVPAGRSP